MPHQLTNAQWQRFFHICAEILGPGDCAALPSPSWCVFTTMSRLRHDAGYWQHGLPSSEDIGEKTINDGGVWGQPFPYFDMAHLIIPRTLGWDEFDDQGVFHIREATQDVDRLSAALTAEAIPHRLTDIALEIKCF